jgi:putative tryptophan/tyrosine transport system substrate-binding protein
MRRREFIAGLGGVAAWPLVGRAQQGERVRRIGVLVGLAESDPQNQARLSALVRGLREFGWTEGRNLRIEFRGITSGGIDRIRAAAAELVASNPDLLFTSSTPIVQELQRQTRTIPIVFANIGDPVDTGIVGSLARPGGNATGFSNYEPAMGGKRLALLKEVAPGVNRVLVMVNSGNDPNQHELRAIEAAASSVGVYVSSAAVSDASEIERAMEVVARESKAGLIITAGIPITNLRELIFALAGRYRLPAVYVFRFFVVDGGLMSYGPDEIDIHRRSAAYVDRILKGEKPGDLPVIQPTKFELVINMKTAKALGLTIPETLLATADEVIQ